jgi:hypothetical protein
MAIYLGITNDGTFVSSDGYRLLDANDLFLYAMQASDKCKVIIDNIIYRVNVNLSLKDGE